MRNIALDLIAAGLLAACASNGTEQASAFPTGTFRSGDIVVHINPDGTTSGEREGGAVWMRGTWSGQGDTMRF